MAPAPAQNWFGSITSSAREVVEVTSVEEIVAIVTDHERYPSPVRAVGSNHSTTACGVADDGTLIVTRKMDKILEFGDDTATVQAGALYIDVNYELRKRGQQFSVNVELGNLTIGSARCGGTKDASMPGSLTCSGGGLPPAHGSWTRVVAPPSPTRTGTAARVRSRHILVDHAQSMGLKDEGVRPLGTQELVGATDDHAPVDRSGKLSLYRLEPAHTVDLGRRSASARLGLYDSRMH